MKLRLLGCSFLLHPVWGFLAGSPLPSLKPLSGRLTQRMAMDGASIDALHHGVLAAQDMFAHLAPVSSSMSEQMVAHVGQGLAAADATAEEAVKQDWFAQFVQLFETSIRSINTFYKGVGVEQSFGLSVVTFTLFIKVLLLPLNYVQLLSTERTQLLQPIQKQINEKFANNEEVKQQVIQRLYTSADVNPLAGCLPSLAQIPVFIGLYRSMAAIAQENIADEPFLWIPNLEGPVFDAGRGIAWLTQNWVDGAPPLGWHDTLAYASIPIFLVLSQSISMRIMSPPTDPNDEAMQRTSTVLKFLPLMIGWFSLNVPSALGVYWMANNVLTTATTLGVKQYLKANPPEMEIPDDILTPPLSASTGGPSMADALEEARLNAKPSRTSRRAAMMS